MCDKDHFTIFLTLFIYVLGKENLELLLIVNRVHMGKRRVHFSPLVILEIKDPPEKNRSV